MKVSIIIPVYKVEKYIERCLLSALNQTWTDLEIILVNDCTPDNSMLVVQRILDGHFRSNTVVLLSHEKNRGQSAARNTGIKWAKGDYIFFLDSDDYLSNDSVSSLADILTNHRVDFVIGNYKITGRTRSIPHLQLKTGLLATNESIISAYAYDLWPRTVWNILIDRKFILNKCLFFKEGIIHEDDLWTFMLACRADSAYVVDKTTYYYYMHTQSTTGSPSLWNLECRVQIVSLLYDYIMMDKSLKENRYVYITFETTKAKYFDRILYFVKDESFRYASYQSFREKKYMPLIRAGIRFRPGFIICLRNLHYLFPVKLGYLYFKFFVSLSYKLLILPAKVKQWLRLCVK